MNSLNSILIEGNLTKDPVVSETPKGTTVCNFRVATNRFYKQNDEQQKEVSYFDVESWSKLADRCGEYLEKGRGVRVVGRLREDRWNDGEGKPHSRIKIVAEHVEFKPSFKKAEQPLLDEGEDVEAEAVAAESEDEVAVGAGAAAEAEERETAEVPF
ncbi:MAG: single-stranded DNA-binding protein [Spirochaetes bacterium]|jgi:single-strand DNA-binding protein|nr:single-stranded DNA-binding protein [Spirochaetota bacterium]